MARIKGAKGKNKKEEISIEPKIKKTRGRQKGDKVIREPAVYVKIDEKNRVKTDRYNFTWQQKGKEENTEENIEVIDDDVELKDNEDKGWKMMGHYPPKPQTLEHICELLRNDFILQKQRKEKDKIISLGRYIELLNKANNDIKKLLPSLGLEIAKKK